MTTEQKKLTIGWIGAGRMGFAMASRLLRAGCDVTVYNRTRSKAEPLLALGAKLAASPAELADRDAVFTIVTNSEVFAEVITGPAGVLSRQDRAPRYLVDHTTISAEASAKVRAKAAERGVAMVDAPVSGNASVVEAGKLCIAASGDLAAFEAVGPFLELMAQRVTYVGEGERSRIVKICHNLFLGVIAQSLAEITVLAEKSGVPRHMFLDFLNHSVMGSVFTRYKTPAYVNLDFKPTFTPVLLRKDLDLGLAAARALDVPLPLVAQTREIVQAMIGMGYRDCDFAALLEMEAKGAGMELKSENMEVDSGL